MDVTSDYRIAAIPGRVSALLADPALPSTAVPGVEAVERLSTGEYLATVRPKPGAAAVSVRLAVTVADAGPGTTGVRVHAGDPSGTLGPDGLKALADAFVDSITDRLQQDDETPDEAATELLVEVAEEVEARPEVPSSGMPGFASVPLVARPELAAPDGPDAPGDMARLAEPHHRLDGVHRRRDDEEEVDSPPPLPERIGDGVGAYQDTPAADTGTPGNKGLGPVVWIGGLALVLLVLILIFR